MKQIILDRTVDPLPPFPPPPFATLEGGVVVIAFVVGMEILPVDLVVVVIVVATLPTLAVVVASVFPKSAHPPPMK